MNREVHYIFSIQTRDYLKSVWERGRRVYLMISPIAQCRADASGEISGKSCGEGRQNSKQAVSGIHENTKGLTKRKARSDGNWKRDRCLLRLLLNFQLKQTLTQPSMQVLPGGLMWVRFFFSIITLCIFFRSSVHGDILCMQSFPEERTQHNLKTRVFCDQWWAKTNKCISYVSRKCLKNLLIFEVSPQK